MGKAKKYPRNYAFPICFDSFVLGGHFAVYESNADTLKDDKKDRKRISRKKELLLSLCYCIHSILFHSVHDFGRIYRTACTLVRGSFHKFFSYALNCSHLRAVSRMKYTENLLVVT